MTLTPNYSKRSPSHAVAPICAALKPRRLSTVEPYRASLLGAVLLPTNRSSTPDLLSAGNDLSCAFHGAATKDDFPPLLSSPFFRSGSCSPLSCSAWDEEAPCSPRASHSPPLPPCPPSHTLSPQSFREEDNFKRKKQVASPDSTDPKHAKK
ncbi:hypothetical protein T484DRAFT_1741606 [Baffinella frigidus]|nr:hypothetical protein T484DRAFT_1741606 [Cryptophyta sp. CCMP2293]